MSNHQSQLNLLNYSLIESDLSEGEKSVQVAHLIEDYCDLLIRYKDGPDSGHIVDRIQSLLQEQERLLSILS